MPTPATSAQTSARAWPSATSNGHIAEKRFRVQAIADDALREVTREAERIKAALRARVEHPFHVVKNLFGYRKVRYKGLAKNTNQLHVLFGLANLYTLRRPLMA